MGLAGSGDPAYNRIMKRFLVLLLIGAAAAFAIWFGMRGGSSKISSSAVTSLLPKETLALIHVPDVNGARANWHETDLYKLWREPAMQDFLQKPLTKVPKTDSVRRRFQELAALEMKDAFFALTSWENKEGKMLAGFRFKGSAENAEKVIGQWRARAQQNAPAAKRETVKHEQHQIEVVTHGAITIATVYDGDWFFAANDLPALKVLLDRADRRLSDSASTLAAEENFIAASKHMPASYAARAYARLDRYFEKLTQALPPDTAANESYSLLRQIRSISAATTFEKGKVRDVAFVAMTKVADLGNLTRESMSLATRDSFLYIASFVNLPKQMPTAPGAAANGFPAAMQRLLTAFAANGITIESWNNTFGAEIGIIGEWAANSRLPSLFATLPVKDAAKASEMVAQFTAATAEDRPWTKSEKEGVQYYSQAPMNPMVPVAPAIALSSQRLVLGHDPASVEAVVKRGGSRSSDLAGSETFKGAERLVPAPKYSFTYIDSALLYNRLDAAVRPMLVMAAAFMPGVADTVDLGKLPQPEIITKHLSPIVLAQSYETDGYVAESVGPVSVYQAALGVAVTTGLGASFYQNKLQGFGAASPAADSPSPSPEETPDE